MYIPIAVESVLLSAVIAMLVVAGFCQKAIWTAGAESASVMVRKAEDLKNTSLVAGSVMFGLFLLILGYLGVKDPPPLADQPYQIVRMTVGLAGGFISAGLGGTFKVDSDLGKASVKAGGPIGVAVFFYLVNPLSFAEGL